MVLSRLEEPPKPPAKWVVSIKPIVSAGSPWRVSITQTAGSTTPLGSRFYIVKGMNVEAKRSGEWVPATVQRMVESAGRVGEWVVEAENGGGQWNVLHGDVRSCEEVAGAAAELDTDKKKPTRVKGGAVAVSPTEPPVAQTKAPKQPKQQKQPKQPKVANVAAGKTKKSVQKAPMAAQQQPAGKVATACYSDYYGADVAHGHPKEAAAAVVGKPISAYLGSSTGAVQSAAKAHVCSVPSSSGATAGPASALPGGSEYASWDTHAHHAAEEDPAVAAQAKEAAAQAKQAKEQAKAAKAAAFAAAAAQKEADAAAAAAAEAAKAAAETAATAKRAEAASRVGAQGAANKKRAKVDAAVKAEAAAKAEVDAAEKIKSIAAVRATAAAAAPAPAAAAAAAAAAAGAAGAAGAGAGAVAAGAVAAGAVAAGAVAAGAVAAGAGAAAAAAAAVSSLLEGELTLAMTYSCNPYG